MKFPLSWLQQWVDLDGVSPEKIAEVLTLGGIEVDSIEKSPLAFSGVVASKVESVAPHPEAENLQIAQVSDGSEIFEVVCGAKNCRAGLVTPFAKIGAKVGEIKIKKAKLRGVQSQGMLCGADELGLSEIRGGIMELDADLKVGTDLQEIFGDIIFEVTLTPNLGHCASILGIARELSALLSKPLKTPAIELDVDQSYKPNISLCIEDKTKCPIYAYRMIKDVKVGPSPQWLSQRLEACGVRSINNIVDATNYVMLELGQPMHAFDTAKIENGEIRVRSDLKAFEFTTLDEQIRTIPENALMISDGKKPLAIGGIMGGQNSEVSDSTTEILVEAAYFQPTSVRKLSKTLGLRSESSARFEKGIDPNGIERALDLVATLIQGICGPITIQSKTTFSPREIQVRLSRINQLLGLKLTLGDIEEIFSGLGFDVRSNSGNEMLVTVPTFRGDIKEEIDLIEEVGRIYGYHNIPKRCERIPPSKIPHSPIYLLEAKTRELCLASHLTEFLTCDLIGPSDLQFVEDKDVLLSVMHPSSIDQSILRPSLLPSMMISVKHNFDRQNFNISAFEIGRIHTKLGETSALGLLMTGNATPHTLDPKTRSVDFYDLKGIIENLFAGFDIGPIDFKASDHPLFHPGQQASITHGDFEFGVIGQVHPKLTKKTIFYAELNITELLSLVRLDSAKQLEPLPLYPGSERDWTITLKDEQTIGSVLKLIKSQKAPLLTNVFLLDLFEKKNATFRFTYRHQKKTLPSEAVDREHTRLIASVTSFL